jgi:hypothetical protein
MSDNKTRIMEIRQSDLIAFTVAAIGFLGYERSVHANIEKARNVLSAEATITKS